MEILSCSTGSSGHCELKCTINVSHCNKLPMVPLVVRALNRQWCAHRLCEPFLNKAIKGIARHYKLTTEESEQIIDGYIQQSDDCFPFSFFAIY